MGVLSKQLHADGIERDQALAVSEELIIACALRHHPVSRDEAVRMALAEAKSWRDSRTST